MRFFALIAVLLAAGCKPEAPSGGAGVAGGKGGAFTVAYPPPTRIVTPQEVLSAMVATNIATASFALPDAKYLLPTLRWIEQDFSKGFWQFKNEMGVSTWRSESFDCDKFAIAASFYGKWLNQLSPNRTVAAALSVGELYYWKGGEPFAGHAINFFCILSGDTVQLVFYEPQTHSVVVLTDAERRSVFFWKL